MTPQELRAWREERGLTQAQAQAWYVGTTIRPDDTTTFKRQLARSWRRYELGERDVPAPLVARIAEQRQREKRSRVRRPGGVRS